MTMYRFKFGLRTLFIVMVPLAALMAMTTTAARTQRQVVAMVRAKGGDVYYRHQRRYGQYGRYNYKPPFAPAWIRRLVGDDYFQSADYIVLRGSKFTDSDLRTIGRLKTLEVIFVDHDNSVTRDGLEALQRMLPKCDIDAPRHIYIDAKGSRRFY